ncbi:MAG: hypothetical protein M5U09_03725, partial [Gammaproteobacteria bacterium]|nr:hypothetical protein [Gammaproteobacteria bacterium]
DPADSPLAKVLFRGSLCTSVDWDFPMPTVLSEVDAQGVVVAQIVLMDSAGVKYYTRIAFLLPDAVCRGERLPGPRHRHTFDNANRCGHRPARSGCQQPSDAGVRLGSADRRSHRRVSLLSQPSGDYICVETQIGSYSHDCWHENGAWYDETVSTRTYRALGSLDGVSVSAWAQACSGQQQRSTSTSATR